MPENRRRVLLVSTSRGDVRGLHRVAVTLAADARAEVTALVGDAALPTWEALAASLSLPLRRADTGLAQASTVPELLTAGRRLADAALSLLSSDPPPQVMVVLGDRHELIPVVEAALLCGVPVAHLGGGELTEGAFDDAVRHALSKLSHLHLCNTEDAARRLRQMGEEPWRVVVSGEPALDGLVDGVGRGQGEAGARLGIELRRPLALVTYHPPTMTPERIDTELESLIAGLDGMATVVATHPAAEPGANRILARLLAWAAADPGVHVVPQLGEAYAELLATADLVAGNSSSGVVEAASFATPVVNIGDRQRGRLHPANVLDVPGDNAAQVRGAVCRALDPGFRASLAGLRNPYGDGHAAERIRDALLEAPLDRLWHKRFVDLPAAPS